MRPRSQLEGCIGQKLGDLLHRPAWTNILVAVQKQRGPINVRDLVQQRRPLDVLLPGAIDLGIHFQVRRIVEEWQRL
jgi:hypothetical protein